MNVKIEESWRKRLQEEFDKPYFEQLVTFVKNEYRSAHVLPPGHQIFHIFNACPFEKVKVVILGQDPYPNPGQYYGVCFSVPQGVPIPGSLANIFKEIHQDLGKPIPTSGNLDRWVEQGVFPMNSVLTVRAHETGSHRNMGWETFTDAVIKKLSDGRENLVFMLWGSYAKEKIALTEDVGKFYRLEEYAGYAWTAHGRYPTNTPGWWGGAHPFALLDYTIVHNGEISSYDANRRYIEMYGYKCNLLTDTEVITYIIDFLNRKQKLCLEDIAKIIAAPFWSEIDSDKYSESERQKLKYFRNVFSSLLITGPFSIILGFDGGLMALNDRLKLRSMVAAEKGDMVYLASEECAIRAICPVVDRIWSPRGGEPIIVKLNEKK